ncbi:TPR domain protein [alpha proteobacterium U9-1i]|nr:TPR domain protein [alpha proteobacterium U9-1i]
MLAGAASAATPAQAPAAEAAAPSASTYEPSAVLRATAPPDAAADRTYDSPDDALLAADLDYLAREARTAGARGASESIWPIVRFTDDLASGRNTEARAVLAATPGGMEGGLANLLEPFLLAAEGRVDAGVARVDSGLSEMPAPLPDVARALVFEGAGRLNEAAAIYALMEDRLDLRPPPESEPTNMEEFERALNAARITHAMYRAALVQHRLGHTDEARRLYNIVAEFAPRSADVERNLARLGRGEGPQEAALTPLSATGRWMLFLSEFLTQAESLTSIMAQGTAPEGLASTSGALFLQLGVLLAGDADDWRLYAAGQLLDAGGTDGAQRIIDGVTAQSPFAPDAEITRANIQLERRNDDAAVAAAERAISTGGDRWTVLASAADIYRIAGRSRQSIDTYGRALAMVQAEKDRADILGFRAYAHRFSGDLSRATADMRQAYEIDQSVDTRLLYVSILMDDPQGWRDGIQMARSLFAEQPDSVLRLNALGYALIQRPEGLEEGYRLLWRGFNYGQTDYSVVDSLGWAYYLYGRFDEARTLIERANELTQDEPNSEILDHLGDVYWRLDRRDDARAKWREALEARPDAIRRRALEQKVSRGLTTSAPRRRELPQVELPDRPGQREET